MCFSVSIVRFGWAGGPQRQFGSFRGWVCRLISFLQMENSLRSDSSICRNNAAAPQSQNSSTCVVCPPAHPNLTVVAAGNKYFIFISSHGVQFVGFMLLVLMRKHVARGPVSGLHQSNMECFFLCNGDETPEIVKPTGAHDFCFRRFIGMFCTRKHGIFDWCSLSPLPKTFLITQKNPSGTSSGQVLLFICTLPSTAWLLFNKQLFKSNFSAFSLKFCLDVFSFCFLSSFFDYLRSSIN